MENPNEKINDNCITTGNVCVICAECNPFLVIGPCDHSICSICSLRIRFKDGDKNCPICKQLMVCDNIVKTFFFYCYFL